MTQGSLSVAEMVKPARVILQIVASELSLDDRDRTVQCFWDHLTGLELTTNASVAPLTESPGGGRTGLQMVLKEPERVATLVKGVSDRLTDTPVEVRLILLLGNTRLQVQSQQPEDFLGILPALDALLPARKLFRARAETYAMRGGELSPVEQANLELLRHRLGLSTEVTDKLIAQALGPYRDRQAKLQKYREVLSAELERQSPLSATTWGELRKLYQALGLAYEDVAPIDQEYIAQIQAKVTQLQQQEEQTRLQEATRLQEEGTQRQIAEQQTHGEQYRQEFQAAITHILYPREFDRGRLEQARRLWDLDPEVVRAIEREVTDERYGAIDSEVGLDYSRLRQLLWMNQWEAADRETERLILSAFSHDMHPLAKSALPQLNCVDLLTLDGLWSRYSQDKFGFRAQYQVYLEQDRRADDFLEALGWQAFFSLGGIPLMSQQKSYRDFQFSLDAPIGHLPTWRWGVESLEEIYVVSDDLVDAFFLHLEKCLNASAVTSDSAPADGGQGGA